MVDGHARLVRRLNLSDALTGVTALARAASFARESPLEANATLESKAAAFARTAVRTTDTSTPPAPTSFSLGRTLFLIEYPFPALPLAHANAPVSGASLRSR